MGEGKDAMHVNPYSTRVDQLQHGVHLNSPSPLLFVAHWQMGRQSIDRVMCVVRLKRVHENAVKICANTILKPAKIYTAWYTAQAGMATANHEMSAMTKTEEARILSEGVLKGDMAKYMDTQVTGVAVMKLRRKMKPVGPLNWSTSTVMLKNWRT